MGRSTAVEKTRSGWRVQLSGVCYESYHSDEIGRVAIFASWRVGSIQYKRMPIGPSPRDEADFMAVARAHRRKIPSEQP